MKEPTREERELRCFRKRRYKTQGDALDAAMVAGVEPALQVLLMLGQVQAADAHLLKAQLTAPVFD